MDNQKLQYLIEILVQGDGHEAGQSLDKISQSARTTSQSFQQMSGDTTLALDHIRDSAENDFARSLTTAFMSVINGSKSADRAFKQFAASFLSQVAQMIMQMTILRALQSIIGFGGGGSIMAGGGGAVGDANGGLHFHPAAAGVMLAATGLAGVGEVSSPTLLPKFNVLAGEAGSEMLTVLARPTTTQVGGFPVVLGSAAGNDLAILSQSALSQLVQAGRPMADGGMTSLSPNATPANLSSAGPSGRIDIAIHLDPGLQAQLVQNSVAQARIAVANDLATDTPIRRNAISATT